MNAYVISLQKPFKDYLYVGLEEIKMNYSIPSAFQKILEKMVDLSSDIRNRYSNLNNYKDWDFA